MKYVTYGKTDKSVSIIGFGGLRFDLSKTNEELSYLLDYAYDKGINYFDTAPGYCDERSEDIFGIAIRRLLKEGKTDFYVSTKGRPTVFDTSERAIEGVKSSIDKLGVKKIDFYHIWCLRNMDHYDLAMKPGGQYDGLKRCQEEGLIDHIVFSSHQPGEQVEALIESGDFEGVTMGLNILNYGYRRKSAEKALEKGVGVVAMNPLSGGTIPDHEEALGFLGREGETATEAAIRFNLSCECIDVTLIGFNNKKEIDAACQIADGIESFDVNGYDEVQKKLGSRMESVCTSCGYCKVCPLEINIPGYMLFYNEKEMFQKTDEEMSAMTYGLEYWNYTQNSQVKSGDCIGCGACENECTQHLPIVNRLKEIHLWETTAEDFVQV